MNQWIKKSIEYANAKNYLDMLFRVYPMSENPPRKIDEEHWQIIEKSFDTADNENLVKSLLKLELFPIKDSYVAFLKRSPNAVKLNPNTVARLCGRLYEMGLMKIYEQCSAPKETNRQIGPLFKEWYRKGSLGVFPVPLEEFISNEKNAILDASDAEMQEWAKRTVNYKRNKGLDFVARFNGKYVIGEAKFLSDFGGHQDAQLVDAIATLTEPKVKAIQIAILDGVVWLKTSNKMHTTVTKKLANENIMSALCLRDFLYSL